MIVADTSLVSHLFTNTLLTDLAREILKKDNRWILPSLWKEEFANVLAKLARKYNRPLTTALKSFDYAEKQLRGGEIVVDTRQALETAFQFNISVYDAHFIVLAINFNTLVITDDLELIKKCSGLAIGMRNFLEL